MDSLGLVGQFAGSGQTTQEDHESALEFTSPSVVTDTRSGIATTHSGATLHRWLPVKVPAGKKWTWDILPQ